MNDYLDKIKFSLFKVRSLKWKWYEIALIFILLLLSNFLIERNIVAGIGIFFIFILIKGFKDYKK